MKKLILSIALAILSLPSFSQNATDTTSVILTNEIARLVIQDLISGDAAKEELVIVRKKLDLNEQKIISQEEIINRLNTQIDNLEKVEISRKDQLNNFEELSSKLQTDLKNQKRKTVIFQITTGIGLVIGLVI